MHDNEACGIAVPAHQMHFVYAYKKQGLFFTLIAVEILCNFKFFLKKLWSRPTRSGQGMIVLRKEEEEKRKTSVHH